MGAGKLAPFIIIKKIKKRLDKYRFFFVYSNIENRDFII